MSSELPEGNEEKGTLVVYFTSTASDDAANYEQG